MNTLNNILSIFYKKKKKCKPSTGMIIVWFPPGRIKMIKITITGVAEGETGRQIGGALNVL